MVSTYAGDGNVGPRDGPMLLASFNQPRSIVVDSTDGMIYVAERACIRKINPHTGQFVATSSLSSVCMTPCHLSFMVTVDPYFICLGMVTTLCGSGSETIADAFGASVTNQSRGFQSMALDGNGRLIIAQHNHHTKCFRKVSLAKGMYCLLH
jgi:hypothetical protein